MTTPFPTVSHVLFPTAAGTPPFLRHGETPRLLIPAARKRSQQDNTTTAGTP